MENFNLYYLFTEILTVIAILSAVAVITSTNPVLAIIFLIFVFINAALYLILNGLTFIGISYIIVYIGAITVFFLFVIMMISTEIIDTVAIGSEFGKILPLVYSISVLFLTLFIAFIPSFLFSNINEGTATEGAAGLFNVITSYLTEILYYFNLSVGSSSSGSALVGSASLPSLAPLAVQSTGEINIFNNLLTIINNYTNLNISSFDSFISPVLQIQILSEAVYGFVAFLLILTSFLLLLAMICPIILTKK